MTTKAGRLLATIFHEDPLLGAIFYAVFAILAGWALVYVARIANRYPRHPERVSFAEAVRKASNDFAWVEISDAHASCENLLNTERFHIIPLTGNGTNALVLLNLGTTRRPCNSDTHRFVGVLERLHPNSYDAYLKANFTILRNYPKDQVWVLDPYGGPADSRAGVYLLLPSFLVLTAVVIYYARESRRRKQQQGASR